MDCGAVFRSPADNGSVATLMKDLKRYMAYDEGEPIPLCIFGGQDAVEKMVSAKDVMSCFSEKLDRLDGLEPAITDFGRQILLAKVPMKFVVFLFLFHYILRNCLQDALLVIGLNIMAKDK